MDLSYKTFLDKFRTQSKVRRQRERQEKKKQLVYKAKLTTLRAHHTFLYISLSTDTARLRRENA